MDDHQLAAAETTACQITDAISRDAEPPDVDVVQLADWLLALIAEVRQARAFRQTLIVMHRENAARLDEMDRGDDHIGGPRWASFDQAARYSGINARTLRDWVHKELLPAYRIGPRQIQLDLRDLDALRRQVPADEISR